MKIRRIMSMVRRTGSWHGYPRTATGQPPLTLSHTLSEPPESVTVCGNTGGVGDKTVNLVRARSDYTISGVSISSENQIISISGTRTSSISTLYGNTEIKPNTNYTLQIIPIDNSAIPPTLIWDRTNSKSIVSTNRNTINRFNSGNSNNIAIGYNSNGETTSGAVNYKFRLYLVEGTYTAETMPPYEFYGYKIPILINPPILPSGYTKLEYIESTGTQYIDTGLNFTNKTKIEITYEPTASGWWYGWKTGSSGSGHASSIGLSGSGVFDYFGDRQSVSGFTTGKATFLFDANKVYVDGVLVATHPTVADQQTTNNCYLMNVNVTASVTQGQGKLYSAKIYNDNDVLVRDFIPARNSRGTIGMYDLVNDVFYTNAGTGSFIAGTEVPNKTINLYSDNPVIYGDDLRVYPKQKKAHRGTTDISLLQDWNNQDWALPEFKEVTLLVDTAVVPSSIKFSYYSSQRA